MYDARYNDRHVPTAAAARKQLEGQLSPIIERADKSPLMKNGKGEPITDYAEKAEAFKGHAEEMRASRFSEENRKNFRDNWWYEIKMLESAVIASKAALTPEVKEEVLKLVIDEVKTSKFVPMYEDAFINYMAAAATRALKEGADEEVRELAVKAVEMHLIQSENRLGHLKDISAFRAKYRLPDGMTGAEIEREQERIDRNRDQSARIGKAECGQELFKEALVEPLSYLYFYSRTRSDTNDTLMLYGMLHPAARE